MRATRARAEGAALACEHVAEQCPAYAGQLRSSAVNFWSFLVAALSITIRELRPFHPTYAVVASRWMASRAGGEQQRVQFELSIIEKWCKRNGIQPLVPEGNVVVLVVAACSILSGAVASNVRVACIQISLRCDRASAFSGTIQRKKMQKIKICIQSQVSITIHMNIQAFDERIVEKSSTKLGIRHEMSSIDRKMIQPTCPIDWIRKPFSRKIMRVFQEIFIWLKPRQLIKNYIVNHCATMAFKKTHVICKAG